MHIIRCEQQLTLPFAPINSIMQTEAGYPITPTQVPMNNTLTHILCIYAYKMDDTGLEPVTSCL